MQFRIAVNEKPENVIFLMKSRYNIERRSAKCYFISGNIFEIYCNEDYDKILAESEDGSCHFQTHILLCGHLILPRSTKAAIQ